MGATGSAMSATRGFVSLELFPLANNKQIQSLTLLFASNPTTTTSNEHSPPRPPLSPPPTPSTSTITPSSTNTLVELPSSSLQPVHVWVSSAKCYMLQRELRILALHQLAFVLQAQWQQVQSKLVFWVVISLQTLLLHSGMDFTFQFKWLHTRSIIASGSGSN